MELTNESGLSGAKHSDRTIFVIVSVASSPSRQAGWHVEVGTNVSSYTTRGKMVAMETHRHNRNLLFTYSSTLTFGIEALGDPVLPKHHIHPLAMATHKQPHLRHGGLANRPRHLTETTSYSQSSPFPVRQ